MLGLLYDLKEVSAMAGGYVRVKGCGRFWRVWAGLMAVVFLACCGRMRVQAAAVQAEDVKEFVGSFYDAWAGEDSTVLWEYYGDGQDDSAMIRMQALFEVMQEWGIGRDVHTVDMYPMEQSNWWVAVVVYDLVIKEVAFPGSECLIIYMQEDGSGLIYNNNGDVDSAVMDEITHFIQEDEKVREQMNETNKEYYEVLTEHPEAWEWLQDLEQAITQRATEIINGEEIEKPQESEEPEDEFYVVQQGDCLWHIAKDKLGSGARWVDLYEVNKDIIGEDPNLILIDMELRIR